MVCWRLSAVLFAACTAVILWPAQGQADDCTSGFMSLERMNRVLDNYIVGAPWNESALLPETNFTCSGSILNLTFGANLRGGVRQLFPEFQLWRPNEQGYYQLVGRITFNQADRIGSTMVYQRNGSPLLSFQAGDVLGFYQPSNGDSKSRILLAVRTPQPVQKMYLRDGNSSAVFILGDLQLRNLLVSVVTDRPNCTGSGFMSNETLRTLVGLEELGRLVNRNPRQQITPDINFTCDGVITNWIIGALYTEDSIPGPELQLWRIMENDTYVKVSGTIVTAEVNNSNLIYGNSSFSPIPFKAGDILGIFVPRAADSILKLRFELARGPRNYFLDLDRTDRMSPHQQFNLTASVSSDVYHPLVSVEISVSTTSTSTTSTSTTSTMQVGSTSSQLEVTTSTMQVGSTSSQLEVTTSTMQVGSTSSQLEVTTSTMQVGSTSSQLEVTTSTMQVGSTSSQLEVTTSTMQVGSTSSQLEVTTSTMQVGSTSSQLEVTTSTMQVGSTSSQLEVQPSSSVAVTPAQTTAETTSLLTPVISQSEFSTPTPIPSVQTSFDNLISSSSTTTKPGTTHTQSPSPPPGSPDSRSQSTLGPGIGAGVGVALLIAVLVVCVCLVIVRRRRRTSKVVLNGQVPLQRNFSNPVYENGGSGNVVIHGTIPAVLDSTYDSPYNDYDSVACTDSTAPGRTGKDTAAATEFDNPLYSDTGPVTFSEVTLYESTDFCGNAGSSGESFYVPTTLQRESTNEGVYSNPEDTLSKSTECTEYAYVTTGARNSEYFEESNIYWEPATNVSDLYQQLSRHKYREIPRQKIEVSVVLGSGQFGVVNRGKWLVGSVEVAIKTLRPEAKEEEKVKFLQEAAINGQFRHPNIVRLHGVVTVGEPVMIVLELLSNGDLRDFLNSLNSRPERQEQSQLAQLCLSFTQQIASGMSYLAGKDFVHRDLAARNILVSEGRICKVADFGMARDLEEGSYYVSHGGKIPVKWTAPEALHYKKYSTASDVWSFGCLMYEIWSLGHKPFEGYTNAQVMNLVTEGYRLSPPPGCPRAMYSLMMSSWNPERSSRPSFTSLHRSLTEDPAALLCWREGDTRGLQTQARHLGAPLEAGKDLYCDLQETYLQKQ